MPDAAFSNKISFRTVKAHPSLRVFNMQLGSLFIAYLCQFFRRKIQFERTTVWGSCFATMIPAFFAYPNLPITWPGFPILLDSAGFRPVFDGPEVSINAAVAGAAQGASYDGVTAALRVNEGIHAPLLCVTDVFDCASGDLSLPGQVN